MATKQTETELVNPSAPNYQDLIELTVAYSDALLVEADLQEAYNDAKSLTEYRRDEALSDAYVGDHIAGSNERQRKLSETIVLGNDEAVGHLEWHEDQALKALTIATVERKRIEAEIGLTKAMKPVTLRFLEVCYVSVNNQQTTVPAVIFRVVWPPYWHVNFILN